MGGTKGKHLCVSIGGVLNVSKKFLFFCDGSINVTPSQKDKKKERKEKKNTLITPIN
jgi:hypothetical protein